MCDRISSGDGVIKRYAILAFTVGWCITTAGASDRGGVDGAIAQFIDPPNPYVIGSGVELTLQLLDGAPTNPNVVFQVWSDVAGAIQAPFADSAPPFVYPASYLNLVTPGNAEIQALVRNSSNQVVAIIKHATIFTEGSTPPPPPPPPGAVTPVANIHAFATTGMAPFAIHVHGLNSTLNAGNENTARYEWDFGDPAGQFNKLVGWNASHIYDTPGTYTVTLRVTNQTGGFATATNQITITADTRSAIYVSPSGNDSNAGTSMSAPVQTFARAAQLLANNRRVLFQRGGTYHAAAGMYLSQQNLIIGAYGSGNPPVLNFTSSATYAKFIDFSGSASNIIVEHVRFDSNFAPNNTIVRALQPSGTNITVRNCFFNKVSYAVNCGGGGPNGLLVLNNHADAIGAYFIWGEGTLHTYIGNTVVNSVDEHNIRIGGLSKFLIAHNDLTNTAKSTIWCMLGDHAYVANNILRSGRFIAGPNFAVSSPGERFPWLVFEANQILGAGVILYSGAEDMVFRNNIVSYSSGDCFSIWGYYPTWNRTCTNITLVNNTGTNYSNQYGKFVKIGSGAVNLTVANNLYCAPSLNQPNSAGNVIIDDADLGSHNFRNNLWANPAVSSYVHSTGTGSKTSAQWATYNQTSSEVYRTFVAADLNAQFVPTFGDNACVGAVHNCVRTDINGNYRPVSGAWTAGAVELHPVPAPNPNPADVNSDGVVNSNDLLLVINAWGICPISNDCPADVNSDGIVNANDLLLVINAWG